MAYIGQAPANKPVEGSDISSTVITGQTALSTAPADTDEFLISDGGVLKRLDASLVGGGKILKIDAQTNNTRATISSATTKTTMLSGTYTNVQASSKILVDVKMPMHSMNSGVSFIGFTWNSVDYDTAINRISSRGKSDRFDVFNRDLFNLLQKNYHLIRDKFHKRIIRKKKYCV